VIDYTLQFVEQRAALLVAQAASLVGGESTDRALDVEQRIDALDRLDLDRPFIEPRQIEEVALLSMHVLPKYQEAVTQGNRMPLDGIFIG